VALLMLHRLDHLDRAYSADVRILAQPVRELGGATLPAAVAEIPWGQNILLVEKLADPLLRLWYARMTTAQGWSRNVLVLQIDAGAHLRHGKTVTNFAATLPSPQSDLARDLLKDPYNFDFLTLADDAHEKHLQAGLLEHLRELLIEPGVGFALVGSRHHLEVGGKDYYLDLLFYHLRLRAFVVIELKVTEFAPEHLGKMNFYLLFRSRNNRYYTERLIMPSRSISLQRSCWSGSPRETHQRLSRNARSWSPGRYRPVCGVV
jgi:predicted nuclease of restriction endonuclease-like (RecB) superfamily